MNRAFDELFETHLAYVVRSLRRLGVSEADVDDVAQEVFVRVHANLTSKEPIASTRAWLFGFARGVASNYRQLARHRNETHDPDAMDLWTTGSSPETKLATLETRTRVLHALQVLDEAKREVLIMADIDGFAGPEIAAVLSIPLNTVYSRLRLARLEFARALKRNEGGGA